MIWIYKNDIQVSMVIVYMEQYQAHIDSSENFYIT